MTCHNNNNYYYYYNYYNYNNNNRKITFVLGYLFKEKLKEIIKDFVLNSLFLSRSFIAVKVNFHQIVSFTPDECLFAYIVLKANAKLYQGKEKVWKCRYIYT